MHELVKQPGKSIDVQFTCSIHFLALVKVRGTENVEAEIEEMRLEAAEQMAAGQLSVPELFRDRSVRWQLISILLLMAAQQLSGINAVSVSSILKEMYLKRCAQFVVIKLFA